MIKTLLVLLLIVWEIGFLINIPKYGNIPDVITTILLMAAPVIILYFLKRRKSKQFNSCNIERHTSNTDLPPSSYDAFATIGDKKYLDTKLPDGRTIKQAQIDAYKNALNYEKTSPNPKFHRTEREAELKDAFLDTFEQTVSLAEEKLYTLSRSILRTDDIDTQILKTKKVIAHYEQFMDFCYSKGEGGKLYFDDMWEHCHNSKKPNFRYIQSYRDKLEHLELDRMRIDEYTIIRNKLIEFISKNNGIKQRDIYKHFDPLYKNIIISELQNLDKSGTIKRIKHGNTYELFI